VDYDHGADFTKYKTYTWVKGPPNPQVSQLADQRIVSAIDEELAKKGLHRVENSGDLSVSYQGAIQQQAQLTTYSSGYGPRWGYGWGDTGISTTNTSTIPVGTLVVDLTDPNAKQLIFRGIATDTLSDKPVNTNKLKKAVAKMFEKYPPKQTPKAG
jgi:hypothetical protein